MIPGLLFLAGCVYLCIVYIAFSLHDAVGILKSRLRTATDSLIRERISSTIEIRRLKKELQEEISISEAVINSRAVDTEMDRLELLDEIDDMTEEGPEYGIGI